MRKYFKKETNSKRKSNRKSKQIHLWNSRRLHFMIKTSNSTHQLHAVSLITSAHVVISLPP